MLVFLHMLGGTGREWDALRAQISLPSIAPNLIGHGRERGGPSPHKITLDQAAEVVLQEYNLSAINGLHLVGTSFGGAVAARLAILLSAQVNQLTLISTALTGAMSGAQIRATEASTLGIDYDARVTPLRRSPDTYLRLFGIIDESLHEEIENDRQLAGKWIKPCWRGVAETDLWETINGIKSPMRLIYGERDPYRRHLNGSSHNTIPQIIIHGAGSFPHRTHPAAVSRYFKQ